LITSFVSRLQAAIVPPPEPEEEPEEQEEAPSAPSTWREWLTELFPKWFSEGFAPYHEEFWDHVWTIRLGRRPRPFVAVWPRGWGKSSSAEAAAVLFGARAVRRYCWYVCATQRQADEHVSNLAAMLESSALASYYPLLATRQVGAYGRSLGWSRVRLRTAANYTIDSLGLDTELRGAKVEMDRPDVMILDDIDSLMDTAGVISKKLATLTKSVLPAGTPDLAVIVVQNLIHSDSVVARLVDGRADFLADRIVSGPHPALVDEAHETKDGKVVLTAGRPSWEAKGIEACQDVVDTIGWSSFETECQHDVEVFAGGTFAGVEFRHCSWEKVPDLVRIVVWCDPAVTDKDSSDSYGVQADGLGPDGILYRLYSWEERTSPEDALRRAILKALELKAEAVGIETDQGGDTWRPAYAKAWDDLVADPNRPEITAETKVPGLRTDKAGQGYGPKHHRAQQMLADYERGKIVHVEGTHGVLERALRRFPVRKPFDLTDAAFWSWHDLMKGSQDYARAYGLVTCGGCGHKFVDFTGDRPCPRCGRKAEPADRRP